MSPFVQHHPCCGSTVLAYHIRRGRPCHSDAIVGPCSGRGEDMALRVSQVRGLLETTVAFKHCTQHAQELRIGGTGFETR